MLRVGLTGGIGSGKSTVAKIFEVFGIPVYYADESAKEIMNSDDDLRTAIIEHFGIEAYSGNKVNRKFIADIVFNNPEKLRLLNSLIHPATMRNAEQWMRKQQKPYAIKEAALIFESGSEKFLDLVVGVSAPEMLRISRVMARDEISEQEVRSRISNQMDEDRKMNLCDMWLINDEQQPLFPQVYELHEKLLVIAEKKPT